MAMMQSFCSVTLLLTIMGRISCVDRPSHPMYHGTDGYADAYPLHPLPFQPNDLEPYMDQKTVNLHYTKHHAGYTRKLNNALRKWRDSNHKCDCRRSSLLDILRNINSVPGEFHEAIKNNGGGYVNHNFFWAVMSPAATDGRPREPNPKLKADIIKSFKSYDIFVEAFTKVALSVFGSGYAWLSRDLSNKLVITTTSNQDSPVSLGLKPILVIDVWEHAYYLKYENRRADFIKEWWKLVDWSAVEKLDQWWLIDSGRMKRSDDL